MIERHRCERYRRRLQFAVMQVLKEQHQRDGQHYPDQLPDGKVIAGTHLALRHYARSAVDHERTEQHHQHDGDEEDSVCLKPLRHVLNPSRVV